MRDGKWKLVMKYLGEWELYDMDADRTELHNLAPENRNGRSGWRPSGTLGPPVPTVIPGRAPSVTIGARRSNPRAAVGRPDFVSQRQASSRCSGTPSSSARRQTGCVRDVGTRGITTILQIGATSERISSPRSFPSGA